MGREAGSETRAPGDGFTDSVKDFDFLGFFFFANLPFRAAPMSGKATQQIEQDRNDGLVEKGHSQEVVQTPRHSMQSEDQTQNEFVGESVFELQFS